MRVECLPFSAIPHTSRLFLDYLSSAETVRRFYPTISSGLPLEFANSIVVDPQRTSRVADVLARQNKAWGAGAATLENIEKLRKGALAAVSGQQVGLFGGPLFSILKVISILRLAQDATRAGRETVPVFWLATEDHDIAEINHVLVPDGPGKLEFLSTSSHGRRDAAVKEVKLDADIERAVEIAATALGDSQISELLRESYRPGVGFGDAFAKLFTGLFRDRGLILLDPMDAEFHDIAKPVLRAAAERAHDIDHALLQRGRELRDAGYHEQVKVTPSSTLLFYFENGSRTSVQLANGDFMAGAVKVPREELLSRIDREPERFSANVLLRPIIQDYLLPTLAYYGGPAEIAYFAQTAVVYEQLLGRVTPILPRLSATLVESRPQRLMKRYNLSFQYLFHGVEHLRELLASRVLPADLQKSFDDAERALDSSIAEIKRALDKLDPSLVDAAARADSKMHYQLKRLRGRAARAELRRNEQIARDADELLASLFPNKTLQERELAGIYFLARYSKELVDQLIEVAGNHCPGHQIVYL